MKKNHLSKVIVLSFAAFMLCATGCSKKGGNSVPVVECKDGNIKETISGFKSNSVHKLKVTGKISKNTFTSIWEAIKQDKTVKIYLDISDTTGLTELTTAGNNFLGLSLPPTVKKVSGSSLCDASELEYIDFPNGNDNLTVKDNVIYNKDMTTLLSAAASIKSIQIPESVTRIADKAFDKCVNLENLVIPETVTSVDSFGDSMKNLKKVVINASDGFAYSFRNCDSLEEVEINGKIDSIGGCFNNCKNLKIVKISGVNYVNQSFYGDSSVTDFELSEGVETVYWCFMFNEDENPAVLNVKIPASCIDFSTGAKYASVSIVNPERFVYEKSAEWVDNDHKQYHHWKKITPEIGSDPVKLAQELNAVHEANAKIGSYNGGLYAEGSDEYANLVKNNGSDEFDGIKYIIE